MSNESNLRSLATLTTEEKREIARKGGQASVEARRHKKTMAEMAQYVLDCPLNAQGIARMKRVGCKVDEKNPTMLTAMIVGQVNAAINGSQKSAEFIMNLIDAKSAENASAQSFIDALNASADTEEAEDVVEE